MRTEDVDDVINVERAAYARGWPRTAFERELTQNAMARYLTVRDGAAAPGIVGFGGLWLMVDEAHIVTVAVLPGSRRRGYGRLIVHGLVALAASSGMTSATLEVRVSNAAARALYAEYGFYEVGLRKRYYSDNHEDALIMTTEDLRSAPYQKRFAALAGDLEARFPGVTGLPLLGE